MRWTVNTNSASALQTPFEHEMAERLVESLQLEVASEDIDPVAPLFGEGLGLDSIDALEIALLIGRDYAVTLRSDDPDNKRIFGSLRSLCDYVLAHRPAA
ncbi:acyl carrier protein [Neoasaia chiangmaiensis]|uniref:Acyl carrier protein n=1 Tax=Neoasaia chiangmaiensis TaxID=320497 RepID=A0A1U9KLT2_9PROT|nr:acyl carrier protein [Neoasaia chiangmaiensis]